jgi:hypothetical protein
VSNASRKRAVSIRMSSGDVNKVKRLAERLGVRDSDVIRYAVKTMLASLAPLYDPHVRGRSLVPVFVESGSDLFLHFEIDATRLDGIINGDVEDDGRVDREDIQLIAMTSNRGAYSGWRSSGPVPAPAPLRLRTDFGLSDLDAGADRDGSIQGHSLREYLYQKYVYRGRNEA